MNSERKVHQIFFQWFFWTILIALALNGRPWKFPSRGKVWLESIQMTLQEHRKNEFSFK